LHLPISIAWSVLAHGRGFEGSKYRVAQLSHTAWLTLVIQRGLRENETMEGIKTTWVFCDRSPKRAFSPFCIRQIMTRPPIHKRWSNAEDEVLKRLRAQPLSIAASARRRRRDDETVRQKAAALGLPPKGTTSASGRKRD